MQVILGHAMAQQDQPAWPAEGWGLADLHFHQFGQYNYGSQVYPQGVGPIDLCGMPGSTGAHGQPPPSVRHGQLAGASPSKVRQILGQGATESSSNDDIRPHPPFGDTLSVAALNASMFGFSPELYPNWLGWPTSDSLAHQQSWDGWVRLAHDVEPFRYWLEVTKKLGPDAEITSAEAFVYLSEFRKDYRENMVAAFTAGRPGLNLVVTSLVASSAGCRAFASREDLRAGACSDERTLRKEHDAAIQFASTNEEWVALVRNPEEAKAAIRDGKLAVVLSMEAGDILGGYVARLQGSPSTWTREDVRAAIEEELDSFPMVSTLQPVHQVDNPFAGGAIVSVPISYIQKRRMKGAEAPDGAACLRSDNEYAYEWWRAISDTETKRAPALRVAVRTKLAGDLGFRSPYQTVVRSKTSPGIPVNPRGLTEHGRILLEVMRDRGMPVDVSHFSDAAISDLDAWMKQTPGPRIYLSHAYPRSLDATPTELHVADATIRLVKDRDGVIGMRPGDDWVRSDNHLVPTELSRLLQDASCQGTLVGSAAFASYFDAVAPGVSLAFGVDLMGFINQPGPVGMPRLPYSAKPCGSLVGAMGSEVDTRGLAHIGLLPQFYHGMRSVAQDVPAVERLGSSADAFLTMWTAAEAARVDAPPTHPAATAVPAAGGSVGGGAASARAIADGSVRLPLYRAIEASLPYDDGNARPQLPTNVGLLVGWKSYAMQRSRRIVNHERVVCNRRWERSERVCLDLAAARRSASDGDRRASSRAWGLQWDREFPGGAAEFIAEYLRPVEPSRSAARISSAIGTAADLTSAFLLEHAGDDEQCLYDYTFTEAAAPGIPTGDRDYVVERLTSCGKGGLCNVKIEAAQPLPDGGGHGAWCYCQLLEYIEGHDATVLLPQDLDVLRVCRAPIPR